LPEKAMPVREAAEIALRLAEEMNFELVDTELVKEPTGHFLRFYIDQENGVTLTELEAFHRRIQPLVERVDYDYLEVSSPGADRPLKTPRDFEKAAGQIVEAKTYKPVGGQKRFVGTLIGLEDGMIVLETPAGALRLAQRDVAVARALIEVDEDELAKLLPDEENTKTE